MKTELTDKNKYKAEFWIDGSYDDLENIFKTLKEAKDWVKMEIKSHKKDRFYQYDLFGWRIMKIVDCKYHEEIKC